MSDNDIEWDNEARQRLKKAPFFVRKIAQNKIEKAAKAQGLHRITVELVEEIKKREKG